MVFPFFCHSSHISPFCPIYLECMVFLIIFAPKKMMYRYMKELFATIAALFCSAMMTAQNVSQFKVIDDSLFQSNEAYQKGNKYQRDAMLFVDMLADTHPYYIKKERRDELFSPNSLYFSNKHMALEVLSTKYPNSFL